MKTSIVLALDARRSKADGTYPIILRITHHGKSSPITLGYYVKEEYWDKKQRKIKSHYQGTQSVARLNNILEKKKTAAMDIITKLDEKRVLESLTILQVKEFIEPKSDGFSFVSFTDDLIEKLEKQNKIGTARTYRFTLSVLKSRFKGKDVLFEDISVAFLKQWEEDHLTKGKALNGLSVYLRSIRRIFNLAIESHQVSQELYPFKTYKVKSTKTRKRALSHSLFKRFEEKILPADHPLYHTRNYFLLSYYLRGMSFTDLAHLKVSDIVDERIKYDRQKNGKPYDVKITPAIKILLEVYLPNKNKEDFILPVIDRITPAEQYKDVEWARQRYNEKLKLLAKLCEVQENITSYVSRHSFATRAKNLRLPIDTISEMLGHSDTKTTEIYLDSLPSDLLDEAHAKVIE